MVPMGKVPLRGQDALDAVAAVDDRLVAEVLAGELHTFPRPRARHAVTGTRLAAILGPAFDGGGPNSTDWVLLNEPELHLGDGPDIVVPDQAGWRRERMPKVPDVAAFTLAPDWVCEVLSPSTERIDRGKKLAIYLRERVGHLWFVAPDTELLEVYTLDGDSYRLSGTWSQDDVVNAPPFESLDLPLTRLWIR